MSHHSYRSSKACMALLIVSSLAWPHTALNAVGANEPPQAGAQGAAPQASKDDSTDKADESSPSFWMDRKMKLSKDLLAGLVSGDAQNISDSARAMRMLNRIEAFSRRSTPGYREQLRNFEAALDEIVLQAEKDNIEGASLGFTQLTIGCVNCHKQLRATE